MGCRRAQRSGLERPRQREGFDVCSHATGCPTTNLGRTEERLLLSTFHPHLLENTRLRLGGTFSDPAQARWALPRASFQRAVGTITGAPPEARCGVRHSPSLSTGPSPVCAQYCEPRITPDPSPTRSRRLLRFPRAAPLPPRFLTGRRRASACHDDREQSGGTHSKKKRDKHYQSQAKQDIK